MAREGSPFVDYSVPSLILFVVVGGSFLAATIAVFVRSVAVIPVLWTIIGGAAVLLLGVRADLLLFIAGALLVMSVAVQRQTRIP